MKGQPSRITSKILARYIGSKYFFLRIFIKLISGRVKGSPILVWQMGKVGSKSLVESIQAVRKRGALFHVHVLSRDLIYSGELYQRSKRIGKQNYLYNECLRYFLQRDIPLLTSRWKIISLVREPVGRNIAAFFQNLDVYLTITEMKNLKNGEVSAELMWQHFIDRFDHEKSTIWFEKEIESVAGIGIYQRSFPCSKGYDFWSADRFDVLLIRVEDLNRVWNKALAQIFPQQPIPLKVVNEASEKWYGGYYKWWLSQLRVPDDYIERLYSSKYARHFYSPDELITFSRNWAKGVSTTPQSK